MQQLPGLLGLGTAAVDDRSVADAEGCDGVGGGVVPPTTLAVSFKKLFVLRMWFSNSRSRGSRMFPNWSLESCNSFLRLVNEATGGTQSMASLSSDLLEKSISSRAKGEANADILFKASKALSEAAFVTASSSGKPELAASEDEIDVRMVIGVLQVAHNTLAIARKALTNGDEERAAAYGLVSQEQFAIFTAGIKINKYVASYVDVLVASKQDLVRSFWSLSSQVNSLRLKYADAWLGEAYRKKVALPLSLLITHFLIVEKEPSAEDFYVICADGISDLILDVMSGNLEKAIFCVSGISSQLPD